jgi:GTP-binding protein
MFVDSVQITVRAGRGGNGCVSFRREKFVAKGGPNGGDGGHGGSIVLEVDTNLNTLLHLHHRRLIRADNGRHGQGSNKTGASGSKVMVPVPPGTIVRLAGGGEALGDLTEPAQQLVVARGGRGGRGNARFATSTNQAPRHAEEGRPGEEQELELELKLMADAGLVGLPNAGKSTLLARISAARPKIASYPFTTLEPYLGVMQAPGDEYRSIVVADVPGLIEGAHQGAGLGTQFLRHVERCRVLVHLVDLSGAEPLAERICTIRNELIAYPSPLEERPWVLIGTKLDAVEDRDLVCHELANLAGEHGVPWLAISAVTGEGVAQLQREIFDLVEQSKG